MQEHPAERCGADRPLEFVHEVILADKGGFARTNDHALRGIADDHLARKEVGEHVLGHALLADHLPIAVTAVEYFAYVLMEFGHGIAKLRKSPARCPSSAAGSNDPRSIEAEPHRGAARRAGKRPPAGGLPKIGFAAGSVAGASFPPLSVCQVVDRHQVVVREAFQMTDGDRATEAALFGHRADFGLRRPAAE